MLKILKWELIKKYNDLKTVHILTAIIFLLAAVFPKSSPTIFITILICLGIICASYLFYMMFYLIFNIILDLRKKTSAIEKISTKKSWEIIAAKLISNLIVGIIWYLFLYIMAIIIIYIIKQSSWFISFANNVGKEIYFDKNLYLGSSSILSDIKSILSISVILPLGLLFMYILAKSFNATRRKPIFFTSLFVIIYFVVLLLIMNISYRIGISEYIYRIYSYFNVILLPFVLFGSIWLYDKRYEM